MSKRLSALAQLVAIYAKNGVTSTGQLVAITGYSESQIWRAKRELPPVARDSDTLSPVTPPPVARDRVEDDPSRARIESTLRVDTYSKKEVEDSVAKAPATAPSAPEALQGSKYAFEGRVIKLLPRDFERWRKAYPAIPNLLAALETADVYFSEDPSGGAWFFRAAAWLQRENTKATAAAKPNWHEEKRRRDAEFLRLARGEAVQ